METLTKLPAKTRRKPVRKLKSVVKEPIVSTPEILPVTPTVPTMPLPVLPEVVTKPVSIADMYEGLKEPVGTASGLKYKAADGWQVTIFGQADTDSAWQSGYRPALVGCIEVLEQSHYKRVKIEVNGKEYTVLADGNDVLWLSQTGDWEKGVQARAEATNEAFQRETEGYSKKT